MRELVETMKKGAREMGLVLSPEMLEKSVIFAKELLKWNKKMNLTAITDPGEFAIKHFLDCMAVSRELSGKESIADLGSGGGFPGIPLKLARPSLKLSMIDSSRKKVNFLKHVIRLLKFTDAAAFQGRAEELAGEAAFAGQFDVAVSRAFTNIERFVRIACPFVKSGGRIIAMKGVRSEPGIGAMKETGLDAPDRKEYRLPVLGDRRTLFIFEVTTSIEN